MIQREFGCRIAYDHLADGVKSGFGVEIGHAEIAEIGTFRIGGIFIADGVNRRLAGRKRCQRAVVALNAHDLLRLGVHALAARPEDGFLVRIFRRHGRDQAFIRFANRQMQLRRIQRHARDVHLLLHGNPAFLREGIAGAVLRGAGDHAVAHALSLDHADFGYGGDLGIAALPGDLNAGGVLGRQRGVQLQRLRIRQRIFAVIQLQSSQWNQFVQHMHDGAGRRKARVRRAFIRV